MSGAGPGRRAAATDPPWAWPGPRDVRVTLDADSPVILDVLADPDLADLAERSVRPMPPAPGQPAGARRVEVVVDGWRFEATVEPARRAVLRERARRTNDAASTVALVVRAPLPGRVVRVWVAAGDTVEKGSRLCSLEAMKMENEVLARRAGTIERVSVEPGARVEHGDELVVMS